LREVVVFLGAEASPKRYSDLSAELLALGRARNEEAAVDPPKTGENNTGDNEAHTRQEHPMA